MQTKALMMSALPAALTLATLTMNLTPAYAEDAKPSSSTAVETNQSCEAKAVAQGLSGPEKDVFIVKCSAEAKTPAPSETDGH